MPRQLRAKKPKDQKPKKAKVLIYGPPGVGKTWTSLEFPNCYYIDVEGGATNPQYIEKLEQSGALYFGHPDASDFLTVLEEIKTLAMTDHDRKTLIIDSYSKLFASTIAEEEERLTAAGEKIAFGNEKKPAVKYSRRLVTWLDKLDLNVILICHEKAMWKNGEQIGETFDGYDKMAYELDLTLQISKRGPERIATIRKSRLEGFPDGDTFDWSYSEFARRYGRDKIESKVDTLKPATDEQVSKLKHLIDLGVVDTATTTKWLEKAGVDTWSEMDSDTIQACIDFLAKKVAA